MTSLFPERSYVGLVPGIWTHALLDRLMGHPVRLSPQERARLDAKQAARQLAMAAFHRKLAEVTNPVSTAVLLLHAPNRHNECEGCDFGGYEGDSPIWPCRTVEIIAACHGIEMPA